MVSFASFGIDPPLSPVFARDWVKRRLSGVVGDRYMLKAGGSDVRLLERAGAPTNGGAGTGAGFADKGSLLIDRTNGKLYQNTNTKASPTWTLFDAATSALLLDGSLPMAAALAMGGFKITGLANGTAATDAAAFGQIPVALNSYVATQVDVASSVAPAAVTGLSVALAAAGVYRIRAMLHFTVGATGGLRVRLGASGGLTATTLIGQVDVLNNAGSVDDIVGRLTALTAGDVVAAGGTSYFATIEATIVVGVAGNLTVEFAQSVSNGTNSSVLVGSNLVASKIA